MEENRMNEDFKTKYLNIYLDHLNPDLSPSTLHNKQNNISVFLNYLSNHDIYNFENFDINIVFRFINSLNYAPQTISGLEFNLREFFDILHKTGLTDFEGREVFPVIFTNKRDRIISFYSTEEVRKVIDVLDPKSRNYTMNKCMVLIAAQIGLRSSDILGLKLSEIKWDKGLIERKQAKTGNLVSVPMPENIRLLLIDYIKNHRPECDSDYVFINQTSMNRYCSTELLAIVRRLIRKTDISVKNRKVGPHALRHSLATRLLESNTPMPVITGILGHKNLNTTRAYLNIDIESLRKRSMEV
jgi:integrase